MRPGDAQHRLAHAREPVGVVEHRAHHVRDILEVELAAAGKPAILVPYPFATGDHQAKNAEHFVRAGGAIMVRDLDLEDVPDHVRSLIHDPARLSQMGAAMLRAARPEAADEIARGLIELATA